MLVSLVGNVKRRAFAPVDNASLIFFRIAFGLLMFWEACRYFQHGWIGPLWLQPKMLFKYYGFSWVQPWPGDWLCYHWGLLGLLGLCIAAGLFYRIACVLFFLGFTYCFLLDQSTYLNHFYLVCLFSFLLIFLPLNRALSIDAWLGPRLRAQTAPAWTVWLLRFQMGVVYFFGGVAKISPDWMRGEPIRSWMARRTDFPVLGQFFREEWAVYAVTYGGLLLDLLIVPALLWRRTRIAALCAAVAFHLVNARLFQIGIFPWLALAATLLFLSPDWPRRLLQHLGPSSVSQQPSTPSPSANATLVLTLLGLYAAIQLLVPLRHLLYPGRVDWTYEGHRFSWRMKLHDRNARARFYVIDDNSNRTTEVNPRAFLSPRQAGKMAARPDMILQFAHFLAEKLPPTGPKAPRVEARVFVSLNGREPQLFVNQNVDLAAEPRSLRHAHWILPMTESLPATRAPETAQPMPADSEGPGGE